MLKVRKHCPSGFPAIWMLLLPCMIAAQEKENAKSTAIGEGTPTAIVASRIEQPLRETPVITDVVTAEEIQRMGARTLNDVLLTLPGFSRIQDHNEYYSAERGVYASSQQKIPVLRDGHRLNCRSYAEVNFGPAISLANVKRIEVMRGPGSGSVR